MKVLSLDPRIGYAVVEYKDDIFNVLFFDTLNSTKFPKELRKDSLFFGPGLVFLGVTKEYLIELMDKYHPDFVVTEDAFHQPGRTNAFRSLSSWISHVSWTLYTRYRKYLYSLAPKEIKKVFASKGTAKKINMKEALDSIPNIKYAEELDLSSLTEHSIDAIGIAIAYIQLNYKAV